MKFLLEHEAGYAADGIGFPSIQGCMAIVLRTTTGLFGYHNYGGSNELQFAARAQLFADFEDGHPQRGGNRLHLYGVTFVQHRGYTIGQQQTRWEEELAAFAAALGHDGPISGVNLSPTGWVNAGHSAYVLFTPLGQNACRIAIKQWMDADRATGNNPQDANQQSLIGANLNQIVTDVDDAGVHAVQPVRLN